MRLQTSVSLLLTPSTSDLCLTLLESVWHPHNGLSPHCLEQRWVAWANSSQVGRELLQHGIARAADQLEGFHRNNLPLA